MKNQAIPKGFKSPSEHDIVGVSAHAPHVAVIVLTWNNQRHTIACLRSLATMSVIPMQVIVVDNGSTDGTPMAVRLRFPDVTVLQNGENLGFAAANNRGIRHALAHGADYIWLLNNDTIVAPDCLSALLAVAESDPKIGMLGPKICYHDTPNRLQSAGGWVSWHPPGTHLIGEGKADHGQHDQIREVDFVSGCALMAKRQAIEATGLLDPDFFAYYEDADWGVRMRRTGFRVVYVPQARVWHEGCVSSRNNLPLRGYYNHRNKLLFVRKHGPWHARWRAYLASLETAGKQLLRAIFPHRRPGAVAALRGIRDFYLGRLGRSGYR
jgi:GT2 family glycosyltransferase